MAINWRPTPHGGWPFSMPCFEPGDEPEDNGLAALLSRGSADWYLPWAISAWSSCCKFRTPDSHISGLRLGRPRIFFSLNTPHSATRRPEVGGCCFFCFLH